MSGRRRWFVVVEGCPKGEHREWVPLEPPRVLANDHLETAVDGAKLSLSDGVATDDDQRIVYELVPRVRVRRRSEIVVDEIVVEEGS